MLTLQECLDQANHAVEMFGTYNYFDKWAWESLDMDDLVKRMDDMTASQVSDLLVALVKSGRPGEHLADGLIPSLDHRNDFEDIYAPELEGRY